MEDEENKLIMLEIAVLKFVEYFEEMQLRKR